MNSNSKRLSDQLPLELRKRILEAHSASEILLDPTNQTIRSSRSEWGLAAAQSEKHDVTVTLKLTEQEDAVMNEYARVCGETVSELIRKALIREATLADGYGADDPQYEYEIITPDDHESSRSISLSHSYTNQRQRLEHVYNRMRSILGWRKINF